MASVVQICNRALQKLGATRITSLDDATKEARACKAAYEDVKEAVLRDHPWNCATARTSLPALSTDPTWGFAKQYAWPPDALYILEVNTTNDWKVEGKNILTDAGAPLEVKYIENVTDPNQFDANFREALAAMLASELNEELNQSNTKDEKMEARLRRIYGRAKSRDAQEGTPDEFPEDDWITVRA